MTGAAAEPLRPTDGRSTARVLQQLATLWRAPELARIPVVVNPRLSRTLGRLVGRPWRIELGPRALASETRLREVVTHEGAHAVLAMKTGPTHPAPHGREWRELMALAGYRNATGAHWACHRRTGQSPQQQQQQQQQKQPTPRTQSAIAYDHWCPVCQSSRPARRPVKAWKCAACVAAGLDGTPGPGERARAAPPTEPLQELARELADWRLVEYVDRLERQPQGEAEYPCKVSHANGKPILFLPNRDQNPGLPSGPTPVQIDGTAYEADFVKIALPVVRLPGDARNRLPEILRGWFGPDAGLPGTRHEVTLEQGDDGWQLQPASRVGRPISLSRPKD